MTDAKVINLESGYVDIPLRLACPLTLNVIDYDGQLWRQLERQWQEHTLKLQRLAEGATIPKGGRQVLLLVDHPQAKSIYDQLEQEAPRSHVVIVVGDTANTELMRRSMRMGAVDFLPMDYNPPELWAALARIAEQQAAMVSLAPVTVLLNGKPGSGVSFISANLAHALAASATDEKVLLVDACLQYGSLSDYFNVGNKQGSLMGALLHDHNLDGMALEGMMSKARERIDLLPSQTPSLVSPVNITAKSCAQLLYLMRYQYQQLVVDMSRGVEHWSVPILEQAEHILVVTQQSLSALRETRRVVRRLQQECGIDKDKIILLVNRYEKNKTLTVKEIEQATEVSRILVLPNDFKMVEDCTDLGKLVIEVERKHKLVRAFADIASHIAPQTDEAVSGSSWLKKLFGQH
ncbi:hypothetical protein CBP31_14255 [Oceanisphaera profunda]|uniref:Pilus assembly protein CpaF n=1 Tax=Oceanisphaera profunda TaxID=1416627 RepID=A0A1Y0D7W5_9GAMM|nr:hypothetical protein [Oceanisphaera profunda]ART83650.1 hypothetical protein CBP31_14255 [Oceanisphaera profunda]